MKKLLSLLSAMLCFGAVAQPSPIKTTPYTRAWLASEDGDAALGALGILSTNQTTIASPSTADVDMGGFNITNVNNLTVTNAAVFSGLLSGDGSGLSNLVGVIDATQYGMDVTNNSFVNTVALQAAIDAATNSRTVYIPPGTYFINPNIGGATIGIGAAGFHIKGAGAEKTRLICTATNRSMFAVTNQSWYGLIEDLTLGRSLDANSAKVATNFAGVEVLNSAGEASTAGSRITFRRMNIYGFYSGIYVNHATGVTFDTVNAYQNVVGFNCPKIDAATWTGCFAGDGDITTQFGSLTNESKGWWFGASNPGFPSLANTIISSEGRRADQIIDIDAGELSVIGCNFELVTGSLIDMSASSVVTVQNCRMDSPTTGDNAIIVANGGASRLALVNNAITPNTGKYAVQLTEANDYGPPALGSGATVTNTTTANTWTVGDVSVVAGTGTTVSREGNAYTVNAAGTASGLTSGLVGWWDFDEATSAATFTDSKNGILMYPTNGCATGSTTGINGNYLAVSNSVDKCAFGSDSRLNIGSKWSLAGWFRMRSVGGYTSTTPFISWSSPAGSRIGYGLGYSGTTANRWQCQNGTDTLNWSVVSTVTTDTWRFLAAWSDGTNLNISYNNGTPTTTALTSEPNASGKFSFGYLPATGFDCDIDSVGVWNRALTTNEVNTLYNSGSGVTYGDL